jgi:hypothetical protein
VLAACGGNIELMPGLGLGGRSSGLVTVREAHDEDVGACAVLAAAERADDPALARARFQADLAMPRRRLFVATVEGCFAGFGRTTHFIPPPGAPSNVAPEGYYVVGLLVDPVGAEGAWASPSRGHGWRGRSSALRKSGFLPTPATARRSTYTPGSGSSGVTRDFAFPGVSFDGGVGVLCRAARQQPSSRPL